MDDVRLATAANEVPVFFDAKNETAFGIVTKPTVEPNGTAVVFLLGTSRLPSTSRNRFYVRMTRRLAARGYYTARFDYHGVGESTGFLKGYGADPQFGYEFEAVVRWFEQREINDIVVIGASFGARLGLIAVGEVEKLKGIVCMAPWLSEVSAADAEREWVEFWREDKREILKRLLKGLGDPRSRYRYRRFVAGKFRVLRTRITNRLRGRTRTKDEWVSNLFLQHLSRAVDHKVPLQFVFGRDEIYLERFEQAKSGRLGEILQSAGDLIQVDAVPGLVHSLLQLEAQDGCIEAVESWLDRLENVSLHPASDTQSTH